MLFVTVTISKINSQLLLLCHLSALHKLTLVILCESIQNPIISYMNISNLNLFPFHIDDKAFLFACTLDSICLPHGQLDYV
jgi:hypothetical protein